MVWHLVKHNDKFTFTLPFTIMEGKFLIGLQHQEKRDKLRGETKQTA
jgi:hypothetical protein